MSHQRASGDESSGECLVLSVPLTRKRRQGRTEIITPEGRGPETRRQPRRGPSLALSIARAHRWQRWLEEGRYGSIRELAMALGVDNSHLARMMRLTLLAPDLIEAILEGSEPDGLSLEKLFRAPPNWENQRRELDFLPHTSQKRPSRRRDIDALPANG